MSLFVCLFVSGNNSANYYKLHLNYCNHKVSRSSMMGVATLPAKQRHSAVQKAPKIHQAVGPLPNPRGRRRVKWQRKEEQRKRGRRVLEEAGGED